MFQGWDVSTHHCPVANSWDSNLFNVANNINRINGDPLNTGFGEATQHHREREPHQLREVLAYQEALGQEDVTTLGDLDNVIWEIANEAQAQPGADQWQEEMIPYIRGLESGKLRHHLIWRTTEIAGCNQSLTTTDGTDSTLFAPSGDMVSPTCNGGDDYSALFDGPKASDGAKVVILDDDHVNLHDPIRLWKDFLNGRSIPRIDVLVQNDW